MGRPPLHNTTVHLNLPQDMLDRMDAIAGPKGRSKFVRQACGQLLDRVAPVPAQLVGRDIWERDGGHDPRLSPAGTAAMLELIRKQGFDQVMRSMEITDPQDFLHLLLGHAEVTNGRAGAIQRMLVAAKLGSIRFDQFE